MKKRKKVLILLIPALLLYLALFIVPAIQAIWVSFHSWTGFTAEMKFIGLNNYKEILSDDTYWQTFITTMKIVFFGGFMVFLLAFLFTFFLSFGIKGKKIFRAIIFYPNVIAPIALATFWGFLYNPRFGLINEILRTIGLERLTQTWTGPDLIFQSVLVALVWTYVGFFLVILLSGVEKIPEDYYDVARIEGASSFQIFFKVILPLIWDVLSIAVVLWIITSLKLFEFLFAFSGGLAAPRQIWTNAVYMFMLSFGRRVAIFRMGYGTAVAVTIVLFVIVFTGIARLVLKRERVEF